MFIQKKTERVGIQNWQQKYNQRNCVYYHLECGTPDMIESLQMFGGKRKRTNNVATTPQGELERHRWLVHEERGELRESLRTLRFTLAGRREVAPFFLLFDNEALNDIVARMPSNKNELLCCHDGMGP